MEKAEYYWYNNNTFNGFTGAEACTAEELMSKPVDILCPCAKDSVITSANAHSIQAKIISEGANGPVTYAADRILTERGIIALPDILANAGGVTVSYFEWL